MTTNILNLILNPVLRLCNFIQQCPNFDCRRCGRVRVCVWTEPCRMICGATEFYYHCPCYGADCSSIITANRKEK